MTPDGMVARARALAPKLLAQAAETEERTYYSQELHEDFLAAGFYRLYVPRRYGGHELDVTTFVRVILELAKGDPSTAWCLGLASAHALQVASWWDERAQAELFGDGDFRAASVAAPIGPATRTEGGWELNGKVSYASGIPYSTHYMGQAVMPAEDGGLPRMLLFVAPRSEWTMLDDWGDLLGMKGSGSQSIVFERGRIPAHFALEDTLMVDVDVSNGTPGLALHGNPLDGGRALGCFTMSLAAVLVGAAYSALDEYERLLEERPTPLPPFVPRKLDLDYQRWYGEALARIATAESSLLHCADRHMALCRRAVEEGRPPTYGDDMLVGCVAREVMIQAWEVVQSVLFRTAGSSAGAKGQRLERLYRDMSIGGNSHRNAQLRDWAFRELARERLGLPRDFERANLQRPRGHEG